MVSDDDIVSFKVERGVNITSGGQIFTNVGPENLYFNKGINCSSLSLILRGCNNINMVTMKI